MSQNKKTNPSDDLTPDEVLVLSAFESLVLHFEISNTTTRTDFPSPERIRLVELLDRGMILEIPPRACSTGHNLMVHVHGTTPDKQPVEFSTTAKVEEIESFPGTSEVRIVLNLLQFNETVWENFCKIFSSRQDEIEDFLRAAKGY